MCVELQIVLKNASYISRLIEKEFAIVPVVISKQNLSSTGVRPGLKFITPVLSTVQVLLTDFINVILKFLKLFGCLFVR